MPLDVQHPPCVTQSIYANSSGQQDRFDLSQFFAFDDYSPRPDDKASWIAGAESVVDDTWNALQAVPEEDQLQFKGPSHDYCAYRQQVGVPMGGLSHVLQVNNSFTSNALDTGWACPKQDWVDKNDASFIATNRSVSTLENCPVGRLWPGMHSQQAQLAALGKAAQKPLQAQTEAPDDDASSPLPPTALVKNEEPVDEDERLLKSEEGKKLTSLQRRQLRNKVSARAFRYRRKEYISQLESDVKAKSQEVDQLQKRSSFLEHQVEQYRDLVRVMLTHPAYAQFKQEFGPTVVGDVLGENIPVCGRQET